MKTINAFFEGWKKPQVVVWKHMKDKTTYHFEFILPFKAPVRKYQLDKTQGDYMVVYARVVSEQELLASEITQGQLIELHLPNKTFLKAWLRTSFLFRSQMNPELNMDLTFTKNTRQDITFLNHTITKSDDEEKQLIERYYKEIEMEGERISRRINQK